jgi:hypothetical protein
MAIDLGNQSSQFHRSAYHKPRTVEDMTERNVQTIVQLKVTDAINLPLTNCSTPSFIRSRVVTSVRGSSAKSPAKRLSCFRMQAVGTAQCWL